VSEHIEVQDCFGAVLPVTFNNTNGRPLNFIEYAAVVINETVYIALYNNPAMPHKGLKLFLQHIYEKMFSHSYDYIIGGDFNIDISEVRCHVEKAITQSSLTLRIISQYQPTTYNNTCIDFFLTSCPYINSTHAKIFTTLNFHNPHKIIYLQDLQ
jgi:hypothetical protein